MSVHPDMKAACVRFIRTPVHRSHVLMGPHAWTLWRRDISVSVERDTKGHTVRQVCLGINWDINVIGVKLHMLVIIRCHDVKAFHYLAQNR